MRITLWLPILTGLIAANLSAGVIDYSVTTVGPNLYQYTYILNGLTFSANEQLDIRFDPTIYGVLSNGQTGTGFVLSSCCQPNNPPGALGDYKTVAQSNITTITGTFSTNFTLLSGGVAGPQPYFLQQLDGNGNVLSTISSGFTTAVQSSTPEPATSLLIGVGLAAGAMWTRRRRLNRAP